MGFHKTMGKLEIRAYSDELLKKVDKFMKERKDFPIDIAREEKTNKILENLKRELSFCTRVKINIKERK